MWRIVKNIGSYIVFVFSLERFLFVVTILDFFILLLGLIKWRNELFQPSGLFLFIGVLFSFIYQLITFFSHFSFLRKIDPEKKLSSRLANNEGREDFSTINVDPALSKTGSPFPYIINREIGALENKSIDDILVDDSIRIKPVLSPGKTEKTKKYILQYKDILLKFFNHKFYQVNGKHGKFTNDKKICLSGEIYLYDGEYLWKINEGCYYFGYLTNFIFSQYIGGTHYSLDPPMNINNYEITSLGDSDFSDHIGVSTLLVTSDGYVIVFRQGEHAGYNAGKHVPSGSGSLDYADYKNKKDKDFRDIVIRGAVRELLEETSLGKKMDLINYDYNKDSRNITVQVPKKELSEETFSGSIETKVLCFYRDMERGGKPEFCCISEINRPKGFLEGYIEPNKNELAKGIIEFVKFDDDKWNTTLLPKASLSLKMNYNAVKSYKGKKLL